MKNYNQTLLIVGGILLLAAIYLSTKTESLPQRDVAAAEPHAPRKNRNGIPPEARGISGKSPRHRSQGAYAKSPETVRIEKRLDDLYANTFDKEKRPFDEAIYASDFKKFIEEEGLQGLRALSESHTKLHISHDPKFFDLELLLPKIIRELYLLGTLGPMVDIIEAMRFEGPPKDSQASDHLLSQLMNSFALDQANSVRIFEEICNTIPERGYGPYFGTIAGHAGRWMGYDKALAILPKGQAFEDIEVQNSFNGLIGAWIFRDAESCKAFMDALPEGQSKDRYLAAFAVGIAGLGKPDLAESVLGGLPPDSKEAREARERIKRMGPMPNPAR